MEPIILLQLSDHQRGLIQAAMGRARAAHAEWMREDRTYKELMGMVMPEGANGFNPEQGFFFYEAPEEMQEEDFSGPVLVEDADEDEDEDEEIAQEIAPIDPETEYEGSEDNAQVEGRDLDEILAPLDEDDEN